TLRFRSIQASDGVPVGIDQHLATADMIRLDNQSFLLHSLSDTRGAVVADPQLPLQVGGRRLLAFGDDLDGLAEQLCLGIVLAARPDARPLDTLPRAPL